MIVVFERLVNGQYGVSFHVAERTAAAREMCHQRRDKHHAQNQRVVHVQCKSKK